MKIHLSLFAATFLTVGSVQWASAQDFQQRIPMPREEIVVRPAPVVEPTQPVDGIIPMAVRSGQPLQMINPLAPASYGDGRYMVTRDPINQKPKGFKLFSFAF